MLNKLLDFTQVRHHRLLILTTLFVLISWPVLSSQIRLGQGLSAMASLNEATGLSALKDLTPLTRIASGVIDKLDWVLILTRSFRLSEGLFALLLLILSFGDREQPWFGASFRILLAVILAQNAIQGVFLFKAFTALNPNTAVLLVRSAGWLGILSGLLVLIGGFLIWLRLLVLSGQTR